MKKVRFNGRVLSKGDLLAIIRNLTHAKVFPIRYYRYDELRHVLCEILKDRPDHILYNIKRFENLQ